ncbi:uncharacterized protein MYCFIDRAFT_172993 [Pseudocercospora fijiensis CIRAD86]|uniref:Uncharacterized protein n=1 Tax=Pseudocercospora fijiensis (strain CIRAD86) TaxID=383855 RepID=M3B3H3_PSEFD|nr:uncharacterized protein MYCFIDRAFT_172993 [Pseudocercospora fijiensis CIRAD86]EME83922.1 hypothetical protein MYCFIDRAFT_172993 [Pseudocercospora fijiensis CIRAD86]
MYFAPLLRKGFINKPMTIGIPLAARREVLDFESLSFLTKQNPKFLSSLRTIPIPPFEMLRLDR